jgi:hypothetical protein
MKILTLSLPLFFALTGIAGADTLNLTFTTLPSTQLNGSYNGFVGGSMKTGSGPDILFNNLVCDDFLAVTFVPSGPDLYTMESIGASLAGSKFGIGDISQYEAAALLINGDGASLTGLTNVGTPEDITSYQYALWRLFASDAQINAELGSNGTANYGNSGALMSQALLDVASSSGQYQQVYDALRIYTPDPIPGGPQEFLQLNPIQSQGSPAPEPFSMLLMGTGLIVVSVMAKRLRRLQGR